MNFVLATIFLLPPPDTIEIRQCVAVRFNQWFLHQDWHIMYCDRPFWRRPGNRSLFWPSYSSPSLIFPPKVSSSSTCSCSSFLPLFALHQSDYTLQQQTNFFPYSYMTQSFLWAKNSFTKCSIDPLFFNFTTQYEKLPLKPNIDKFGKHPQTLPLLIFCTSVPYSNIWLSFHWIPRN